MERKEKIKMLADFNSALENIEIQGVIVRAPSGSEIWEILQMALNAKMDSLLSDEEGDSRFITEIEQAREQTVNAINSLQENIQMIQTSPVMAILERMGATLSKAATAPTSVVASTATDVQTAPPPPPANVKRRNPEGRGGSIAGLI